MGIFNYHKLLQSNYPDSFCDIQNNNIFDNVYIDGNFVLHSCVHGIDNLNELIVKLHRVLNILFRNFIAKHKIYFALDGVASMAKILLQRKRRQLSSGLSLELIPGTQSMKKIEEFIQNYLQNLEYKFFKPQIITSFTNQPGEGEIKLFSEIKKSSGTHLIIGNDSDIIVLASCINKPNINILFKYPTQNIIFSIDKLIHLFGNDIRPHLNNNNDDIYNLKMNLSFVSLMMGNDYLEKIKGISAEKLWMYFIDFMKKTEYNLIIDGKINKIGVDRFLYFVYSKSIKSKQKTICDFKKCKNYVNGIQWCLDMYINGQCVDNTYTYTFDCGPDLLELLVYISSYVEEEKINKCITIPTQLYPIILLPYNAKHLIDPKLHHLMDNEMHYLYEAELCEKCKIDKEKNSELFMDKSEKGKEKYNKHNTKYIKHKRKHPTITIEDIHFILSKLGIKL